MPGLIGSGYANNPDGRKKGLVSVLESAGAISFDVEPVTEFQPRYFPTAARVVPFLMTKERTRPGARESAIERKVSTGNGHRLDKIIIHRVNVVGSRAISEIRAGKS